MGVSGTIMAVAAVASAGASIYNSIANKPKPAPTFESLQPPNPADAQIKADAASVKAADAQRKKTAGAKGFQSTILTSPQGTPQSASLQPVTGRSTLLGS
ncbi:MAG: hypothetical protein JWL61_4990 [Gemmatimonadetes bacterium]|nr:hypothetical protein [Gemmatimonadota bacterium]